MISIWNLDSKNVPSLHSKRQTSSLAKFPDRYEQRNTRARREEWVQYLGIEGSEGIQRQQMESRLQQEYSRRLTLILQTWRIW